MSDTPKKVAARLRYGAKVVSVGPKCHPRSPFNVFCKLEEGHATGQLILACSVCETPVIETTGFKMVRDRLK
jgi:hypothetical protein